MDAPTQSPRATIPGPRCDACQWPIDATLHARDGRPTHPCCDPASARTVTRWADLLHNAAVRARADAARDAYRYTRGAPRANG